MKKKNDSSTFLEELKQFVIDVRERRDRAIKLACDVADGTYGANMSDYDKGWVAGQTKLLKDLFDSLP